MLISCQNDQHVERSIFCKLAHFWAALPNKNPGPIQIREIQVNGSWGDTHFLLGGRSAPPEKEMWSTQKLGSFFNQFSKDIKVWYGVLGANNRIDICLKSNSTKFEEKTRKNVITSIWVGGGQVITASNPRKPKFENWLKNFKVFGSITFPFRGARSALPNENVYLLRTH